MALHDLSGAFLISAEIDGSLHWIFIHRQTCWIRKSLTVPSNSTDENVILSRQHLDERMSPMRRLTIITIIIKVTRIIKI